MTEDPLTDVFRKIAWADKHFAELYSRLEEWRKSIRVRVVHEHDAKTGWHALRAEPTGPVPSEAALVVGDYAITLRTSLDYLARALVRANGSNPDRRNKFPVFLEPPDEARFHSAVRGMHPAAVEELRQLQPYQRPGRIEPEGLEIVSILANADKHVGPHAAVVLAAPVERLGGDLRPNATARIVDSDAGLDVGMPLGAAPLFRVRVDPPETELEITTDTPPAISVGFGDPPIPVGRINQLTGDVRAVVERLRPFITDPPPEG